jgi:hypothetical protein
VLGSTTDNARSHAGCASTGKLAPDKNNAGMEVATSAMVEDSGRYPTRIPVADRSQTPKLTTAACAVTVSVTQLIFPARFCPHFCPLTPLRDLPAALGRIPQPELSDDVVGGGGHDRASRGCLNSAEHRLRQASCTRETPWRSPNLPNVFRPAAA